VASSSKAAASREAASREAATMMGGRSLRLLDVRALSAVGVPTFQPASTEACAISNSAARPEN
jgi:hypothetical protein